MGLYPRVARWDNDELPDLILGTSDGYVYIHLNVGTPAAPLFDTGQHVQVGPPGNKADIAVGGRATPEVVDWNEDGFFDLLVGSIDGKLRLYYNEIGELPPGFRHTIFIADGDGELLVPLGYSSPTMADFDGDGAKDLVCGNSQGELYFYPNLGSHAAPAFGAGGRCESLSVPIDLGTDSRARPFAYEWDGDGQPDILTGSGQGHVHLFLGQPLGVAAPPLAAAQLRLEAPWPNPANPASSLSFTLAEAARARLSIHDASGRRLVTLLDEERGAGRHELIWRGEDAAGRAQPSGLYLVRLQAAGAEATQKLLLLR